MIYSNPLYSYSIHLRPVMPLFKEERNAFICGYPILVNQFKALVVYTAKAYRIFVQPSAVQSSMKQLLDDMYEFYSKKGMARRLQRGTRSKVIFHFQASNCANLTRIKSVQHLVPMAIGIEHAYWPKMARAHASMCCTWTMATWSSCQRIS